MRFASRTASPGTGPVVLGGRAVLFDCDGVLVDSRLSGERAWILWAEEFGVDKADLLKNLHGRRSGDTVAEFLPENSRARAVQRIEELEMLTVSETHEIPGAGRLLSAVGHAAAVVTSAPLALYRARTLVAGVTMPVVVITGGDVPRGKPAPDAYLRAAQLLGVPIEDCIVVEDSVAGVASARAANAGYVLGVGAAALATDADVIVEDLSGTTWFNGRLRMIRSTVLRDVNNLSRE